MRAILRIVPVTAVIGLMAVGLTLAAADGKALYGSKCAMCHGADGVAKEMWAKQGAKNFNDPAFMKTLTDEQLTKDITEGIPAKKMPAFKEKMSAEEIAAVVKYIRTLAPAAAAK